MNLLILPIALPFLGAALCILLRRSLHANQLITVAVAVALLLSAVYILLTTSEDGIQVLAVGEWGPLTGIVLVADLFSAIMLCLTGVIGLAVALYSVTTIDARHIRGGYYPLLLILLGGVSGAFLTGDFFNLYVWFEVMLMSSFVLVALGGGGLQLEAALKYVTLNVLSSIIFLATLGLLYSTAGTVNFAYLAQQLPNAENPGLITAISVLFLIAFGIKAALFPLFFWLPASYHTPPVAVSALFAGLLTKVGVYSIIRVFSLLFVQDTDFTHTMILAVSGLTMVTGVLGAVAQYEFRKLLAFHIISQIGYMTMGLGLFTPLAVGGAIFYMAHNIIAKSNLFLVSGLVYRLRGTFELKQLGGMHAHALLALAFLVPALSLAGVPPLSGFFAKLTLARAGIEEEQYLIVGVALAVGLLTLFSMMKIWNEVFAKAAPPEEGELRHNPHRPHWPEVLPVMLLAVITIAMGLGAGPFLDLSVRAGEQLLQPAEYIDAVMGSGPSS